MPQIADLSLFNDANLQAYYKLEDATDDKNANDLTNTNSVGFAAAKFNNGADFGSSDADKSLNIASNLGYGGGAYAISGWFKQTTDVASGTYSLVQVVDAGSDTTLNIIYDYNSGTRRLVFQRVKVGVAVNEILHTVNLGTTIFHHLVLTYDGATVEAYLDNASVGTVSASGSGTTPQTSKVAIGSEAADTTLSNFLGIADDVAFFDRNLTVGEVSQIFTDVTLGEDRAFFM